MLQQLKNKYNKSFVKDYLKKKTILFEGKVKYIYIHISFREVYVHDL